MTEFDSPLVEHFFRHESANLIAVLTRAFGVRRIELIEDTVQSAMLEAMRAWRQKGPPDNPAGWIHRVARNRLLDSLRRDKAHERAIAFSGQTQEATESLVDQWLQEDELSDSLLRMIFVCCHPALNRSTQIALTLKVLCGLGVEEISRALLIPVETVKKRIQRSKQRLADLNISMETPGHGELQSRLDVVHDVLYLLFNEGYSTSKGTEPIRDDLCEEAARLCQMLCVHPEYSSPTNRALLALMLFHGSRLEARVDSTGSPILLEDQDRRAWDRSLIQVASNWLARSKTEQLSKFHFEAAIAQEHCRAEHLNETDWHMIVQLYDQLIRRYASPVYALNRAIALGQAGEVENASIELDRVAQMPGMAQYFLVDCARARLFELSNERAAAVDCYLRAMSSGVAPHEQSLLEKKIRDLNS